jgi:hypothetical protein
MLYIYIYEPCITGFMICFLSRKRQTLVKENLLASVDVNKKVKISLSQAMEAPRVARGQGSHIP